jgi:hypothetical protein
MEKSLTRACKRAEKLGLPAPTWKRLPGFQVKEYTVETRMEGESRYSTRCAEVVEFEIEMLPIGMDGWVFSAIVEPVPGTGKNAVIPTPDNTLDLSPFNSSGCRCDHCGTNRQRSKCYVLARGTEAKQVGSSCLKDFFPATLAQATAGIQFSEYVLEIVRSFDSDWTGNSGERGHSISDVLSLTCAIVEASGYVSRSRAFNTDQGATADHVQFELASREKKITVTDAHEAKGKAIMEWAKAEAESRLESGEIDGLSYWQSVQAYLEANFVPARRLGFIVGLVGWKAAHDAKKAKEAASAGSEWIGTVGERATFTGKIKAIRSFESAYGTGFLTTVQTDTGIIKYWNRLGDKDIGDQVSFMAKVKEHVTDSYMGGAKVTVVQRATKIQ